MDAFAGMYTSNNIKIHIFLIIKESVHNKIFFNNLETL